jgi:hypothetical protein
MKKSEKLVGVYERPERSTRMRNMLLVLVTLAALGLVVYFLVR